MNTVPNGYQNAINFKVTKVVVCLIEAIRTFLKPAHATV